MQRKAARFVTGQHSRHVSVTGLMDDLGWRALQERRLEVRLALLHKTINGQAACTIPPYIPPCQSTARASHPQQYRVPEVKLDVYKYSYFPRTFKTWNLLPESAVIAPDVTIFKERIHRLLLDNYMYVVTPRGDYNRPRLGSTSCVTHIGPVY